MEKLFPTRYTKIVAKIKAARCQVASFLTSTRDEALGPNFFDQFQSLDPAAKEVLTQPGVSRLHQAAYLGVLENCKHLIESRMQKVDTLNARKETPLHYAVRNGQLGVAQYLLDKGAKINTQRDYGACALHLAFVSYNTEDMLQLLLHKGADPHLSSSSSLDELPDRRDFLMGATGTPLNFAIRCEQLEAARILLEAGADPNKKDDSGLSPLQTAIFIHSMPPLEFILPWAIKNMRDRPIVNDLYNPLVGHYAQPMFRWLYWHDETPMGFILPAVEFIKRHHLGFDERVLLSWALDSDEPQIVDYYLNKLWTVERPLIKPFRPLRVSGDPGSSWDIPLTPDLKQLFSVVLSASSKEMIQTVLKYMEKPVSPYDEIGRPFTSLLAFRQYEPVDDIRAIVSVLIEAGISITTSNPQSEFGPIKDAAAWNNVNLVDVLLDYDPSLEDVQGAIQICIGKGNSMASGQIMRSIYTKCPQVLVVPLPEAENSVFSIQSLHHADHNYLRAFCSRVEFSCREKLQAGPLAEAIQHTEEQPGGRQALRSRFDESGLLKQTPLHHAAFNGNVAAAEMLLEKGANINTYHVFVGDGPEHDFLSKANYTIDLSALDEKQKTQLFLASGPTPLDEAYRRDWGLSLFQWLQTDQGLINELRQAGGAFKEQDAYEARTLKMIDLLREQGAKTRNELFGKPNTYQEVNKIVLNKLRTRYKQSPLSDTAQRIWKLNGATTTFRSAQNTLLEFPGLVDRVDLTRPRLSALYIESIQLITGVLSKCSELGEIQLHIDVENELEKYQAWAEKNGLGKGDLDPIADIPLGLSRVLSAAVFSSLREIIYTLGYFEEILLDRRDLIE